MGRIVILGEFKHGFIPIVGEDGFPFPDNEEGERELAKTVEVLSSVGSDVNRFISIVPVCTLGDEYLDDVQDFLRAILNENEPMMSWEDAKKELGL